jgi:hypothetical protein
MDLMVGNIVIKINLKVNLQKFNSDFDSLCKLIKIHKITSEFLH